MSINSRTVNLTGLNQKGKAQEKNSQEEFTSTLGASFRASDFVNVTTKLDSAYSTQNQLNEISLTLSSQGRSPQKALVRHRANLNLRTQLKVESSITHLSIKRQVIPLSYRTKLRLRSEFQLKSVGLLKNVSLLTIENRSVIKVPSTVNLKTLLKVNSEVETRTRGILKVESLLPQVRKSVIKVQSKTRLLSSLRVFSGLESRERKVLKIQSAIPVRDVGLLKALSATPLITKTQQKIDTLLPVKTPKASLTDYAVFVTDATGFKVTCLDFLLVQDEGEGFWNIDLQISNEETLDTIQIGSVLHISINEINFTFRVNTKSLDLRANRFALSGKSLPSLLLSGPLPKLSGSTAKEIVGELLDPYLKAWQCIDFPVKSFVPKAENRLEAAQELCAVIGAIIECDPGGMLSVIPKHGSNIDSYPAIFDTELENVLNFSEDEEATENFNRFRLTNRPVLENYKTEFNQDDGKSSGTLLLFTGDDPRNIQVESNSPDLIVSKDFEMVSVTKEERVVFKNSKASLQFDIESLDSTKFYSPFINLDFEIGTNSLSAQGSDYYGLVDVIYKTKALAYRCYSRSFNPAQILIRRQ